jgi:hypothetical protein
MSRAPTDAERLALAIEQLEAERRRREDERIAAGTAIRLPLDVVAPPGVDDIEELVAQAKSAKLAAARADGDDREILFEEPQVLVTGVPRSDDFGKWAHERFEPEYPDRYATTKTVRPPAPPPPVAPSEPPVPQWTKIKTQVTAPSEGGLGGVIAEGWFSVVGGELRVEDWRGRMFAHPIAPGDDAAALARKVLREKFGQHHSFDQPIHYPRRSYH